MSVGSFFLFLAALLFFFAGIGVGVIPNATTWGLFCLALGILLAGVSVASFRRAE